MGQVVNRVLLTPGWRWAVRSMAWPSSHAAGTAVVVSYVVVTSGL